MVGARRTSTPTSNRRYMESYQGGGCPKPNSEARYSLRRLSPDHRRMLLEESGISPEIVACRGYQTVTKRSELEEFPSWQRRLGLYVPIHSPDGETVRCQLRPDKPRKEGPKYETPHHGGYILDCNPRMLAAVRDPGRDLWVTEGSKKVDALASHGEPCIGLMGVHMFAVAGTEGKVPLDCWRHVPLEKRLVRVAFDSDCLEKEGVQLGLQRQVAMLEELGADVRVVYLPGGEAGEKVGVDDYLAGGTVAELRALARRFEPEDLGRIRLSRDEKLRTIIGELRRTLWMIDWNGMAGHSARDVFEELLEAAAHSGKSHQDGVRISISWRALQERSKVSSRTLSKALSRLEKRGIVSRDNERRETGQTGAFVLRALVKQMGRGGDGEGMGSETERGDDPSALHLRAPRLRWSDPGRKARRGLSEGTTRVRDTRLPARLPRKRLGKIRGAVLDALDAAGGSLPLQKLYDVLHPGRAPKKRRPRDLRRRQLPMLVAAEIIEISLGEDGDAVVYLAPDWLEALGRARELGVELEAERLQRERHARQRKAFRNRGKAPKSKPRAVGLEAVRRERERIKARLRQRIARAEEERRKAGPPPGLEALISRVLLPLGRLRMGLLCEVADEEGFDRRSVSEAVRAMGHRVERLPEYGNEEFVYARLEERARAAG